MEQNANAQENDLLLETNSYQIVLIHINFY